MKKAFDSHELASVEKKPYESAMRLAKPLIKCGHNQMTAFDPASADAEQWTVERTQTATGEFNHWWVDQPSDGLKLQKP